MTEKLHLIQMINEEEGLVLVEFTGVKLPYEMSQVSSSVLNGLEVSYNEEDESLVQALKHTTIKYITVDTFADDGDEHDVYEHKAIIEDGEIKMDKAGNFLKSYKNEKSAIKFAESFGVEVRIN